MKEVLKKLNNFRLSALLVACGALVGLIAVILALILYQTSGLTLDAEGVQVVTIAFHDKQALGMVFFIFALLAIILGIVVIYRAFPYIMPKTSMTPFRSLTWVLVAENAFVLALLAMIFVLLGTESTRHAVGFVISVVLGTLSVVYSGLLVYPCLKCRYYMPALDLKK